MLEITAQTALILFGSALVLLMVLGYMLFDLGSVRAKNTPGTIVRHIVVSCATAVCFLFMGFGLTFGGEGGLFGVLDFFTLGNYGPTLPDGVPLALFIASQTLVAVAVANIVCGALAERSNIAAQVGVSIAVGLFVYPFVSRWTWGAGWLAVRGFHDFAGSASLNVVAGAVALVGSAFMGPRAGKYGSDGALSALPGQSLARCFEGALLICVGWIGLVCVSLPVFGVSDAGKLGEALLGMLAAASTAPLACAMVSQLRYRCVDIPMVLNAFVGGLAAVSSGADVMGPVLCGVLGVVAGVVCAFGIEFVERALKVDDPVGAIATHGFCGLLGFIFVALFADGQGLVFGGWAFALIEVLGAVAILAWTLAFSAAVFAVFRRTLDVRVSPSEEESGLGLSGPSLNNAFAAYLPQGSRGGARRTPDLPPEQAVPLELMGGADACALKKVEVLCRPQSLEVLRVALGEIGVTGMTVTAVQGCGEQKGARETYRGVPVDVDLIPKVQVDIVVSRVPVSEVVRAARRALYTGHIGDGKIFVYGVAEAIKVRTGEHGFDAVQSIGEVTATE